MGNQHYRRMDRAITASVDSDYLAIVTIIARSAGGGFLQDELLRHWESFDDLTADQILVVSPKSRTDDRDACVSHWREAEGLVNYSLKFGKQPPPNWDRKFWESDPVNRSAASRFYDTLAGVHTSRRPQDEMGKRAAITASASETARYFGIPESWLPCVVVLSLSDQCLLVISIDQWFSLYSLLRAALIDYEPVVRAREQYKRRAAELPLEIRRQEESVGKTRSTLITAVPIAEAHVAASWNEQIEAACRMLMAVSKSSPQCREFADFLVKWLHNEVDTPSSFDSQFESWFASIIARGISDIPEHLVLRMKARLPGTIQRKISGYCATTSASVKEAEQTVAGIRARIEKLNVERSQLSLHLADVKAKNPMSRSFLATANSAQYRVTDDRIQLPPSLCGWAACHVTKRHGGAGEAASGTDRFDIALSFAGEDREVARELANRLRSGGATVFFDEFEKCRLFRENLVDYLTAVYFERARFCMMIISESYVSKMWTGLERRAIQAGALVGKIEAILPVRLDNSDVPGLLPTISCLDYRKDGVEAVVSAALGRLRFCRDRERNA